MSHNKIKLANRKSFSYRVLNLGPLSLRPTAQTTMLLSDNNFYIIFEYICVCPGTDITLAYVGSSPAARNFLKPTNTYVRNKPPAAILHVLKKAVKIVDLMFH